MIRELGRDPRLLHRLAASERLAVGIVGPDDDALAVMLDSAGALWAVAGGSRSELVRWCLFRHVLSCPSLVELHRLTDRRGCVGLLPDAARLVAVPFVDARSG